MKNKGIFGFIMMSILLVPFYFIRIPVLNKTDPENRLDNVIEAFYQIYDNYLILLGVLGKSIARNLHLVDT